MRRLILAMLLGLFGCTEDTTALVPDNEPPPDQQNQPLSSCEALSVDRRSENLEGIQRLGLLTSEAIVEGRLGALRPSDGSSSRFTAPMTIEKVWFGPSFIEGMEVFFDFHENELAALETPGTYLVGTRGNAYPIVDDGGLAWWGKHVFVPSEARAKLDALLGYRADRAPWAAVVRIVAQDEDRTTFSVVEPLAGDLPQEFQVNWSERTFAVDFPEPSDVLYVAGLSYLSLHEGSGVYLAQIADLRPATEASKSRVLRAISDPVSSVDASLLEAQERYALSWSFFTSPSVLRTEVSGMAAECCTGAGGTYVSHEVLEDLRQGSEPSQIVLGGHAYYSDEACGDAFLLGLRDVVSPPAIETEYRCEMNQAGALPTALPVPRQVARLSATDDNLESVRRWIAAEAPVYRIAPPGSTQAPPPLTRYAPWSEPLSLEQALAFGGLVLIEVIDVREEESHHVVRFETTFTESRYDHQTVYEAEVAVACADPRLLEVGAQLFVPMMIPRDGVRDVSEKLSAGEIFILPGAILPRQEQVERISSVFRYELNSTSEL